MNNYVYILITFIVTIAIRTIPIIFIRKPITSPFLKSFLYYAPYVTLAIMTFPSIINATDNIFAGICALIVGIYLAWKEKSLPIVASACFITVLIIELFV